MHKSVLKIGDSFEDGKWSVPTDFKNSCEEYGQKEKVLGKNIWPSYLTYSEFTLV